ncbi:MAG TPA: hypothetical protein VML75_06060, partial [Kofleriaceae bacterium]|nr:hypothetical protein [Kofleriaceae bacterium]
MSYCPTCKQSFDEDGGFCPYDGSTLQPGDGPPKIHAVSAAAGGGLAALDRLRIDYDPKAEYEKLIGTTLDGRYHIERT